MDDKDLSKLRRADMLELMVTLSEENDTLREQMKLQKEQLDDRDARFQDVEAIADVALRIQELCQTTQETAAAYREDIGRLNAEAQEDREKVLDEIEHLHASHEIGIHQQTERRNTVVTKCLRYSAAAVVLVCTMIGGAVSFRKVV